LQRSACNLGSRLLISDQSNHSASGCAQFSGLLPANDRTLSGLPRGDIGLPEHFWWAVSIEPFQVGRSRLRRMRFAMGIQSYLCCLIASLLPANGIVERSSRSRWLHYAPAMKVLSIRKCLIVGTRSVRRASGLLETGLSVTCLPDPLREET
jgi:hypothetical protein